MLNDIQWVPIVVLVGLIIYQGWLIWHVQKVHDKTVRDLLDRLMSNNYATYVNGEAVREQFNKPPVFEEERGIPL